MIPKFCLLTAKTSQSYNLSRIVTVTILFARKFRHVRIFLLFLIGFGLSSKSFGDGSRGEFQVGKYIEQAYCKRQLPKSSSEIEVYYRQNLLSKEKTSPENLVSGAIEEISDSNFRFENEDPKLVQAIRQLLSVDRQRHAIDSKIIQIRSERPIDFKDYSSRVSIPKNCQKILCLAKAIFGEEVGPQMLFLISEIGVNTSPFSFYSSTFLRADEIRDIIQTFELVPASHLSYFRNYKLTRYYRGQDPKIGPLRFADHSISLFDPWGNASSLERRRILLHEMGHVWSSSLLGELDASSRWLDLYQTSISQNPTTFVSSVASQNAQEDFAESLLAYRINPVFLKSVSPQKYLFIKEIIFDGVEFDHPKNCERVSNLEILKQKNSSGLIKFSLEEKDSIKEECAVYYYWSILSYQPNLHFQQCVNFFAAVKQGSRNRSDGLVPITWHHPQQKIGYVDFKDLRSDLTEELSLSLIRWIKGIEEFIKDKNNNLFSEGSNAERCYTLMSEVKKGYKFVPVGISYNNLYRSSKNFDRVQNLIEENEGSRISRAGTEDRARFNFCMDLVEYNAIEWTPNFVIHEDKVQDYLHFRYR